MQLTVSAIQPELSGLMAEEYRAENRNVAQRRSSIWYATEEKFNSLTKWIVFSDRGSLEFDSKGLFFKGHIIELSVTRIQHVTISQQPFPWLYYVILAPLGLLIMGGRAGFRLEEFTFSLGLLVVVFLFVLLVSRNSKWILVEYYDDDDRFRRAYFAEGSLLGWGGILGETQRLYQEIRRHSETAVA